mmetsp:Transcript_14211/g.23084  ORF Transcript_14211/g.23084 Transcript_14211/m.23084 type:complete len:265 (+) Transcript_14211:253-1047(+)
MGESDLPMVAAMDRHEEISDGGFEEIEIGFSLPATVCCIVCAPCAFAQGWWSMDPKEEAIILNTGVVTEIVTTEGCHWSNPCCREIRRVSTSQRTYDIPTQKITDLFGNPVIVSAILTYRFVDPKKAALNVTSPESFVHNAASAALKEVIGQYSYDELKEKSDEVSQTTVEVLQPRVATAGAYIQSVTLNGLAYAPEIAQAMLRKQQAQALIDARQLLVEGSVDISIKAVETLERTGNSMTDAEKAKLVSDLIVVSVGEGNHDS